MTQLIANFFQFDDRGTTLRRELLAGLSTFLTMAYIIFLNPIILSNAGMPLNAAVAATCLGALLPTLIMGLWANYPIALASGMGINAAVVMHANQPGMDWQTMMGVIVIEGMVVTCLVLSGFREKVVNAIPTTLKHAISAGIGLFIALLGFDLMGLIEQGSNGALLTHGSYHQREILLGLVGLFLVLGLQTRKVPGAILYGIIATAMLAGMTDFIESGEDRMLKMPESFFAWPDFTTLAQANLVAALKPSMWGVIFAFLMTDFFDTVGTIIGVGKAGNFLDQKGRLPGLKRVLLVDSGAAIWGGFLGCSSVTTYIESASGVTAGGRTGLVSVVVAVLFGIALFAAPLVTLTPAIATAPALVGVGLLMLAGLKEIEFTRIDDYAPALLCLLLIPLTQSISFGIGAGVIAFVLIKAASGKGNEISPWMIGIALLFLMTFWNE